MLARDELWRERRKDVRFLRGGDPCGLGLTLLWREAFSFVNDE
jgi:hypothetical protein